MTTDLVQRAGDLGLVSLTDDGRFRVADRRFLTTGSTLAHLGVPLDAVLDEWEALVALTDEIAARFLTVFDDSNATIPTPLPGVVPSAMIASVRPMTRTTRSTSTSNEAPE